jgi:hypothetical protein
MAKARTKKSLYILVIVLMVAAIAIVGVLIKHHDDFKTRQNLAVSRTKPAVKGSTSTPQAPTQPTQQNLNPGGAVDKNGQTTGRLPASSNWVSSASNSITLQQPSPNGTIANGDAISGTASVDKVAFILKDNSVGLIAQGSLIVVNGRFSGLMEFQAHSSSGKLEVYYPNPTNGREEDLIEINVNFKL